MSNLTDYSPGYAKIPVRALFHPTPEQVAAMRRLTAKHADSDELVLHMLLGDHA